MKLAVLADDLTGALDTGVQFSSLGWTASVRVGTEVPADADAAVCDLETRHLTPASARARTAEAVRNAQLAGAEYIYLKTDSGLRGNVGAGLGALCVADGPVLFAPAYPENGRVTADGVHYIDGVPVSKSLFGRDPLTPVRCDRVAEILHSTDAEARITEIPSPVRLTGEMRGILSADAGSDGDLERLAKTGLSLGIRRFGGCAGFARQLARLLSPGRTDAEPLPAPAPLLVLCGSLSPVSLTQLQRARAAGLPCFLLREEKDRSEILTALQKHGAAAVVSAFDTSDATANDAAGYTAASVAEALGRAAGCAPQDCGLFVIGGDTLAAVIRTLGDWEIRPLRETESGVVLCSLRRGVRSRLLVTKSGSFGGPDAVGNVLRQFAAANQAEK